jgi:hypothetical protein
MSEEIHPPIALLYPRKNELHLQMEFFLPSLLYANLVVYLVLDCIVYIAPRIVSG